MMKAKDLRDKTSDELLEELSNTEESLHRFRFQNATGSVEDVRAIRNAKRDIARIKTILRERELAQDRSE